MDNNHIYYIEGLIEKDLMEQITTEEEIQLELEKGRYSEDEYNLMVVEALRRLKGRLPAGVFTDWQPDIPAFIQKAKAMKAAEENQKGKKYNE